VGLPLLWQARLTAGRFDERGRATDSERDRSLFAQWASRGLADDAVVLTHKPFGSALHVDYGAARQVAEIEKVWDSPPKDMIEGTLLLDARKVALNELRTIARLNGVSVVGPYWRVDRSPGSVARSLVALKFEERVPRGLERLGLATDLVRTIRDEPDPWATWEWRVHVGLQATAPTGEPATFDEVRIAHNVAIAQGQEARAAAMRARLLAELTHPKPFDYTGDVRLLGFRLEEGPPYLMTLLVEAGPTAAPTSAIFTVKSKIIGRPWLWPTVVDWFEKEVSTWPAIGGPMFKPRYLYAQRFVVHKRMGKERFTGYFSPLSEDVVPPRLLDGAPRAILLTLD
jgi:hypothetical protein